MKKTIFLILTFCFAGALRADITTTASQVSATAAPQQVSFTAIPQPVSATSVLLNTAMPMTALTYTARAMGISLTASGLTGTAQVVLPAGVSNTVSGAAPLTFTVKPEMVPAAGQTTGNATAAIPAGVSNTSAVSMITAAPQALTYTVSTGEQVFRIDDSRAYKLGLTWDKKTSEPVYYNVYRKKAADADFVKLNPDKITGERYLDETVMPGNIYVYRLETVNAQGQGEMSGLQTVSLKTHRKLVPDVLNFDNSNVSEVRITWSKVAENVYYNVYRKEKNGDFIRLNTEPILPTKNAVTSTAQSVPAAPGSSNTGNAFASLGVSYTAQPMFTSNLSNTGNAFASSGVSYTAQPMFTSNLSNTGNAFAPAGVSYTVQPVTGSSTTFNAFAPSGVSSTSMVEYTDTTVTPSTEYIYKLEGTDEEGYKTLSNDNTFKTAALTLPGKPTNYLVYQDTESITLKWDASTKGSFEVSGYNIYRGTSPSIPKFYKFVNGVKTRFDDGNVVDASPYYYYMKSVDLKGNESAQTDTVGSMAYPPPRTGLILMPTAFRNDIYNNFGLNVDMMFSYFIGSIYENYDTIIGKKDDPFSKIGLWLLTADVKASIMNEGEMLPSTGIGYMYTIMLQDKIGSSETTNIGVTVNPNKASDSIKMMNTFYGVLSKYLGWETAVHGGYMFGDFPGFIPYLSQATQYDNNASRNIFFVGADRPLFNKMGFKMELLVPAGANRKPLSPDNYLIDTHIDRFINFDVGYFKFPGGYSWLGYMSFRFTIFPNPYKVK